MHSCNNLVLEPSSYSLANPRVDQLEQQFASIKTIFEGLMKQMAKNTKVLAKNAKGIEEINNLLSKDKKS